MIVLPRATVDPETGSADLTTVNAGQATEVEACAVVGPLFTAETLAVFGYVPQLANAVALVTCTETCWLPARSPKLQTSVCEPGAPLIEQVPGPEYVGLIDQSTPLPEGNGSFKTVDFADPDPLLVTVTVKPMFEPSDTLVASATFTTTSDGQSTDSEADAEPPWPLPAPVEAVLL